MRWAAFCCVTAFAVSATAQQVDFSAPPSTASPSMADEVLLLRFKGASVEQVLKEVAQVSGGEWVVTGGKYLLQPDAALRRQQANAEDTARAQQIEKALRKSADAIAKLQPGGNDDGESHGSISIGFGSGASKTQFDTGAPGHRAIVKLALGLGAKTLAAVPEGGRVVFSTAPTRMQRPLGTGAGPILAAYVAEYNAMVAKRKNGDDPMEDVPPELAEILKLFEIKIKPKPIKGAPAKALLIARRRLDPGEFTLELDLYDGNGNLLASDAAPLGIQDDPKKPGEPPTGGDPIALSPMSLARAELGNNLTLFSGGGMNIGPELFERMRDPAQFDPLSYGHSDYLLGLAQAKGVSLVAALPDEIVSTWTINGKEKLSADGVLRRLQDSGSVVVEQEAGLIRITPARPTWARAHRANRLALRDLIAKVTGQGYGSLDDVAAYARVSPPPASTPAAGMYYNLFLPQVDDSMLFSGADWNLLRLFGTFSATQKAGLAGGRIEFGSLTPPQHAIVAEMLFGADVLLNADAGGQPKQQDEIMEVILEQIRLDANVGASTFRREPTEVMPNGLPAEGVILVSSKKDPVLRPVPAAGSREGFGTLDAVELGILRYMKEDPNLSQEIGPMLPQMTDFRAGSRTTWNFQFVVALGVSQKSTLQDERVDAGGQVYKADALPGDMQARLDAAMAMIKKNPFFQLIGSELGKQAPPPRG